MLYPELGKLRHILLAPITKRGVRYSLFLLVCQEHYKGKYFEGMTMARLQQIILTGEGVGQFEDCLDCREPSPRSPTTSRAIASFPTIGDEYTRFLQTRSLTYSRSIQSSWLGQASDPPFPASRRGQTTTYLPLSAYGRSQATTHLPLRAHSRSQATTHLPLPPPATGMTSPPHQMGSTSMHPLFTRTRLRRAPITYDVSFTPSARTVLDRSTHSAIPSHTLSQPATDPPTPAGARLVLRSHKFPWPVIVTASHSSASLSNTSSRPRFTVGLPLSRMYSSRPGTENVPISNLDVLYAVHTTLMVPITPEECEALGHGSKAQQKVTHAYERRCTRTGGGWEGGVRRIDWLGEKTWLIGVEVDKAAGHGGAGKLVFGRG